MKPQADLNTIKRILFVRTDRMGDVVVTTPVFSAVKKAKPDIHLAVMVNREYADLVECSPYVDEVIYYDKKGSERSWWSAYAFARRLEYKRFDAAVHFHPRARMYWTTFLARIPVRIGWRAKNYWLLTTSLPDCKSEGKKHEAEYNFDLLKLLRFDPPSSLEPFIPLRSVLGLRFDRHLKGVKKYIVFNPSASCPSKIWPAPYFAEVADHLAEKYGVTSVIIGGKSDRRFGEAMCSAMRHEAVDLTGQLEVGELGWLMKKAGLFISNDTGPVHIASAVGTPVISIFGRSQPGLGTVRWRPLGRMSRVIQKDVGCIDCLAHRCILQFRCLQQLLPQEVIHVIENDPELIRHVANTD